MMARAFATQGVLGDFFPWWIRGLLYLLPPSLRRAMQVTPDRITIEFAGEHVKLNHYTDCSTSSVETKEFQGAGDELQKTAALQWLKDKSEADAEIILLVPKKMVLEKSLMLPGAAEENLRQVLGFEMDRKTPFTPDKVYYDYSIVDRDKEGQQIQVELYLTLREQIDPLLNAIRSWDIALQAISITDGESRNCNLNLLDPRDRPVHKNKANQTVFTLAVLAFVLFIAVLWVPVIKKDQRISNLEAELLESRNVAMRIQTLREERDTIIEKTRFLAAQRADQITAVELLNELTRIIPDDTWLTQLVINAGEIQLQGESKAASSLIQAVESSDFFTDAKFRSSVTKNNITNKDRFHLSARLQAEQPI
ncbi:MAG: PilN domain-containing protein [Gammaproteobacteria bacterium]|nr:PilN domain-containing protein [Gammaproteobacteria bacterium]